MRHADYIKSYARFSPDKTRRFVLFRQWDIMKPIATVIGLNPSTADDNDDDPTIGFVYRILNHNGYGGFFMTNLFTMITPHPKDLIIDEDIDHSIKIWRACAMFSKNVIFAWGRFDTIGRDQIAKRIYKNALCFGKLKQGQPRHPMYLKNNTELIYFL